jgi:LmbE family N-acetylglucosaminyl deacetylase
MATIPLDQLGRYDALYLSPHADDAALSVPGRIRSERDKGQSVVVVALFASEAHSTAEALARHGVDLALAGLPPATIRRGAGAPFRSVGFERTAEDHYVLEQAVRILADIGPRLRARQVYVPLGVGGHIDHRLTHEAAMRAFGHEPGRNVFLYEERPEAFSPGAVRVRLGLVGARLPPGAAHAAQSAGLASYLLRFHLAPTARGDLQGWADRFGSFGPAASEWRSARAWNPQKAFGPRLQPVVAPGGEETLAVAQELWSALLPPAVPRLRSPQRFKAAAAAYAQRLGASEYAERYWLVLPSIHGAAEASLVDPLLEESPRAS